jgi:hypothetical protein
LGHNHDHDHHHDHDNDKNQVIPQDGNLVIEEKKIKAGFISDFKSNKNLL